MKVEKQDESQKLKRSANFLVLRDYVIILKLDFFFHFHATECLGLRGITYARNRGLVLDCHVPLISTVPCALSFTLAWF